MSCRTHKAFCDGFFYQLETVWPGGDLWHDLGGQIKKHGCRGRTGVKVGFGGQNGHGGV